MASKTRQTRKRPTRRKTRGAPTPGLSGLLASGWFLNALFVLMLIVFAAFAVERIWSWAVRSETFTVNTSNWDAEVLRKTLPEWMTLKPEAINAQISRDEFLSRPHSIFEANLVENVAARYEKLPWIKKVTRVEKIYPNKLRIEFIWRMPAAKVQYQLPGKNYLVDEEGMALEPVYDEARLDSPLPLIVNAPGDRPVPRPGETWPQEEVRAAARLAKFLQPLLRELKEKEGRQYVVDSVEKIDVSGFGNERQCSLTLLTRNGKAIEWGNAVGGETSNEPGAEKKLATLRKLYNQSCDLSAWRDQPLRRRISLRWNEDEIVTSD